MPVFAECSISKVTDLAITSRTECFLRFLDEAFFPAEELLLSEIYYKLVRYCKEVGMDLPAKHLNVTRLEKKCEMELIHFGELLVGACVNSPKKLFFLEAIMKLPPATKEGLKEVISLFFSKSKTDSEATHNKFLLARIEELEEEIIGLEGRLDESVLHAESLVLSKAEVKALQKKLDEARRDKIEALENADKEAERVELMEKVIVDMNGEREDFQKKAAQQDQLLASLESENQKLKRMIEGVTLK